MRKIVCLLICTLMLPMVFGADAAVSFVVPQTVVSDVPFSITVQVDSAGVKFVDYDLTIGTDKQNVLFDSGFAKFDPFKQVSAGELATGPTVGGKTYHVRTDQTGALYGGSLSNLFLLSSVRLPFEASGSKFVVAGGVKDAFTPGQSGVSLSVVKKESAAVTVVKSSCGDGVVGYVDGDNNGLFDKSKEQQELCDIKYFDVQNKLVDNPGCKAGCLGINKEYRVSGFLSGNVPIKTLTEKKKCDLGSNCILEKLKPRELFKSKVDALVEGTCFPYNEHADADYCDKGVGRTKPGTDGKLILKQKIDLVAQVGVALRELLDDKTVVEGTIK